MYLLFNIQRIKKMNPQEYLNYQHHTICIQEILCGTSHLNVVLQLQTYMDGPN